MSSRSSALELRGEHVHVADLEVQPQVAVVQDLLVDRHAARERHRAGAERLHDHAGRRQLPERRGHDDVRAVDRLVLVVDDVHAPAQARPQRRHRAGLRVDHGLPRQILGEPPQRAQEQPQRAALLAIAEADPQRAVALHALLRGHPRPQQLVARGEIARQQLARGLIADGPRVHPPEEQLDELARDLGGEHPLDRRVEGADVQRAAVPERDRPGARRPRLVHVDEIQRRDAQRLLDRPRDVHRRRRVDPLAPAREQQLAHPEHPNPTLGVEQILGMLPRGPDQPPRLPHQLRRARRRQQQHPMAPSARAPARPQRQTSQPRSHPPTDAARPGRWQSGLPLSGRITDQQDAASVARSRV